MANYVVVTDSCSDLTQNLVDEYQLPVYPMEFVLDEKDYRDYPDEREIDLNNFYKLLKEGHTGSTAQISPANFIDFFTPFLEKGLDILYVAFSSALSGTYSSSLVARDILLEKYKERKIVCIDSLSASTAQGKLVLYACENLRKGLTLEENEKDVRNKVPSLAVWFTVDDLNCLKRGGRLSSTAAFFGTLLGIKPVLHVSDDGKLIPMQKCRGRKSSLIALFNKLKEDILDPENDIVYISHAASEEDALAMGKKIEEELHIKNIVYSHIGPVIGMHSGPGTFLVSYFGKKR